MLAEPFSFSATPGLLNLLERLDSAYPGCQVLGGLASAGEEPGQNRIIFDGHTLRHGLVGVAVWGGTRVDAVVSQGCRPIGKAKVVTRADGNVIYELGGQAPLEVVKQLLVEVAPQDRRLLRRRGLLLGCVANEYQQKFARGDFVIRNPLGFDPNSGAMAVNDLIRIGQTVQFHVRDEASASEDLEGLLAARHSRPAVGALLFTLQWAGDAHVSGAQPRCPGHPRGLWRPAGGGLLRGRRDRAGWAPDVSARFHRQHRGFRPARAARR